MSLKPRGVSLLELLVALTLFGLIGTLFARSSLQLSAGMRRLQQRATAGAAVDQGATWLTTELSALAPGDLRLISADALSYRGIRFAGLACEVTATEVRVMLQAGAIGRLPQPGRDSLLLYVADGWSVAPVIGVSPTDCAGTPALRITSAIESAALAGVDTAGLTPVRLFEAIETRFYSSAGAWWLGGRSESAGEGLQPLAGPYRAAGVRWVGFDAAGAATMDAGRVRSYAMDLVGEGGADSLMVYLLPPGLR